MTSSAAQIYREMRINVYEVNTKLPKTTYLLVNARENPTEGQVKYLCDK